MRAESFENRNLRDFGLFSQKSMPSKKVSGIFAKVIFAKTKLLTKIKNRFFSILKAEKPKIKKAYGRGISIFRPEGL